MQRNLPEHPEIAYTGYHDIVRATSAAVSKALDLGMYVGVASHDHPVINSTIKSLMRETSYFQGKIPENLHQQSAKERGTDMNSNSS